MRQTMYTSAVTRFSLLGCCLWFATGGVIAGGRSAHYLSVVGPGPLRFQSLPKAAVSAVELPPLSMGGTEAQDSSGKLRNSATDPAAMAELLINASIGPNSGLAGLLFLPGGEAITNRIASPPPLFLLAPGSPGDTNAAPITAQMLLPFFQPNAAGTNRPKPEAGALVPIEVEFVPPRPFIPPASSKATMSRPDEK